MEDLYQGCLLGLACGDAVGTTVEFSPRGTFPPMTDMVGGGPFGLIAGQWTDDTSMALCLAESLLTRQGFDATDQMARYANWYQWGYWSAKGICFDIGMTTKAAICAFLESKNPYSGSTDPQSAGNGSIMRLAPVVMYYLTTPERLAEFARLSSRTTHAAPEAEEACVLLAEVLARLLSGDSKETALNLSSLSLQSPGLQAVAQGTYCAKPESEIEGCGYAVKSLEAAMWCFWRSNDFEEAILRAANLGDDADTTAAIAGQIAGAFYGAKGIPGHWLERLAYRDDIQAFATALFHAAQARIPT